MVLEKECQPNKAKESSTGAEAREDNVSLYNAIALG